MWFGSIFLFLFCFTCAVWCERKTINQWIALKCWKVLIFFIIFFSKEIYCAYLTNFYLYKYDITLKQISNDDKDNILHQQLCWNPALFLFFACVHLIANCQLLPESCASDHAHTSTKLLPPTTSLPFYFCILLCFPSIGRVFLVLFFHLFPVVDILGVPPSLSLFPRRTSPLSGVVKQQRGVAVIARSWWEGPGTAGPILPNPGGMETGQGGPLLTPGLLFL